MTDQERQLLEELAGRIQKAPPSQVDPDADQLIHQKIGSRPDALYILTQTVLIQEMALNQAKQQLDQLKTQQPPASFLGNAPSPAPPPAGTGFGGQNARPPQPSGFRASTYQSGYVPPPPPAPAPPPLPQYAQTQYVEQPRSGMSSFLHNAAQTAAGVVAGEVAFSAISSLFGNRGGGYSGWGGGGFLGGGGGNIISPVSETIINNNYYEEGDRGGGDRDRFARDESGTADNYRPDDSPDDNSSDDTTDDSTDNADDSSSDDSSSYDDGSDSSDS